MEYLFSRRVSILPSLLSSGTSYTGERKRNTTYPLANSSRKKDRRWPLVLRFWKGSIHGTIIFPVFIHAIIAAFVVYVNQHITSDFNLPSSIVPSLSIVVGLMLVFRNQTAYSRFWGGRLHINTVTTSVRCLSRQILVLVPAPAVYSGPGMGPRDYLDTPGTRTPRQEMPTETAATGPCLSKNDESRTIETVKILIAMLYTIKNHLRAEWGVALSPGTSLTADGQEAHTEEYKDLLPTGLRGYEHKGLGLTLQLSTFIENFIQMGVQKKWFHNAASSSMLGELNTLIKAYGNMEVIRLVPIPVAHLIHHKQTLALFCGILPFAMASEMDWWAVPLTAFVAFTLYGIEGIAQTYEDPFGVAKIDINMDDIVEDARREVEVMLLAWQSQDSRGGMFRPYPRDGITSETSSEVFNIEGSESELRVVVSDLGHQIQLDAAERERQRMARLPSTSNAREIRRTLGSEGRQLSNVEEGSPLLRSVLDPRKDSGAISPGTSMIGTDYMSINNSQRRVDAGDSSGPRISWSDGRVSKSSV